MLFTRPGSNVVTISDDKKTSGFADSRTIEGLCFWTDLIHKHKASATQAQMTDTSPIALFEAGRVAMLSDRAWAVPAT